MLFFQTAEAQTAMQDSVVVAAQDTLVEIKTDSVKPHLPARATMFSAVLPGLGQIYNKKYWKLPIIYGGFIGLGYGINYFSSLYNGQKKAYFDLNDSDPETKSYLTYFSENYIEENSLTTINTILTREIETNRRQRDIMIIVTAGFYLLNVLDANVDAHFITFDISEDLTFNFEPVLIDHFSAIPAFGAQLSFTF
jgi:hypothetical protein